MDEKNLRHVLEHRLAAKVGAVEQPLQQRAMAQLKALSNVPGALKIITNVPDPKAPAHLTPVHPHYYVAHDVERLEGPDGQGLVWAISHEGDRCGGYAHQLLGRLTQYSRAEEFSEEREAVSPRPRRPAGGAGIRATGPAEG